MSHKLIPILFALTACGGIAVAPSAQLPDEVDAGTIVAVAYRGRPATVPDAGVNDAGEVDPPGADAGHDVAPSPDAGAPVRDAGTAVVLVDAGPADAGDDACDNAIGDYWLVTGDQCGRQIRVACIQRWDECGLIGQPGCLLNGTRATGSGFCIEGGWPAGSAGTCSHCR